LSSVRIRVLMGNSIGYLFEAASCRAANSSFVSTTETRSVNFSLSAFFGLPFRVVTLFLGPGAFLIGFSPVDLFIPLRLYFVFINNLQYRFELGSRLFRMMSGIKPFKTYHILNRNFQLRYFGNKPGIAKL